MSAVKKTNAMRILDNEKINYVVYEYEDDKEHALSRGAALKTSEKLSETPERVFKTIVMKTDKNEIFVFLEDATHEINLKKARNASGTKEIAPIKPDTLLSVTGYIRGGCSPIGMKKKFRTFIDESALNFDTIFISAGVRGLQLEISPKDLQKITDAKIVDLKNDNIKQ